MYNTFEMTSIPIECTGLRMFNQIYLYIFISLFIYVVLSLFLAIIIDTFENIKNARGGHKNEPNELETFIGVAILDRGEPMRFNLW